jgi:hypothetical protein
MAPIKVTHEPIGMKMNLKQKILGREAHSKDVDTHFTPYIPPFAHKNQPSPSSKSILDPYVQQQKSSNLPSILGPYFPPSTYPISYQGQQRHASLNPPYQLIHMNHPYWPYSSTIPKSFGSNLDVKQRNQKFKNPPTYEDHYVQSNRQVNTKKKETFKRPQRSTKQRRKTKKMWVPKSLIKEANVKVSKSKGKAMWIPKSLLKDLDTKRKSQAVWIPKSLLKGLNEKEKKELASKLPKASTPSPFKHFSSPKPILGPHVPKVISLNTSSSILSPCVRRSISPTMSKPKTISPTFPLLFHRPSRCVSMLILPKILSQKFQSPTSTYYPSILGPYIFLASIFLILHFISFSLPYQHL